MRPGDLVRIYDPVGTGVYVISLPNGREIPDPYPDGTLAVFLGSHGKSTEPDFNKALILVEGMQGWVYDSEIEVISEAG